MTSVHSKLVQSRQYVLLKTTSQRHCINNTFFPGYGLLDAVTTQCGLASAGGRAVFPPEGGAIGNILTRKFNKMMICPPLISFLEETLARTYKHLAWLV
jgi:hypothetical protein